MPGRTPLEFYDAQFNGKITDALRRFKRDNVSERAAQVELAEVFGVTVHHTTVRRWMQKVAA